MRTPREVKSGRPSGRTQEIQRLVGRSLRAVTALEKMGECSILIDCDVLQADGGTRTASITAGYLALAQAVARLAGDGSVPADVLTDAVAAVSAGIVGDELLLDLCYEEDARAEVDFNVVMTGAGSLVEVQGTAEGTPFSRAQLDELVNAAAVGDRAAGRVPAVDARGPVAVRWRCPRGWPWRRRTRARSGRSSRSARTGRWSG